MRIKHIVLLGALLSGCNTSGNGTPSSPNVPSPNWGFKEGIELADSQLALSGGLTATTFNFAYLENLFVRVKEKSLPGMSLVTLQFTNPGGELFYTDKIPFTMGGQTTMMGPQGEMDALAGTFVTGGVALDRRVPILGSVFTRYPPDGDWLITATVDGIPGQLSTTMHVTMVR